MMNLGECEGQYMIHCIERERINWGQGHPQPERKRGRPVRKALAALLMAVADRLAPAVPGSLAEAQPTARGARSAVAGDR